MTSVVDPTKVLEHARAGYMAHFLDKFKPRTHDFLKRWCAEMKSADEWEMNRAWGRIPSAERDDTAMGRVVAEMICNYVNHLCRQRDPSLMDRYRIQHRE